jgi:hypothetical protein
MGVHDRDRDLRNRFFDLRRRSELDRFYCWESGRWRRIGGCLLWRDVERLEVTCVLTLPKLLYISFFVLILLLLS